VTCAFGVGGGGFCGIAFEVTPNTYVAPTKFFPILTDGLTRPQATQWRRPIRQNVDILGAVPGDVHVEGDIEMECLTDAAVYFHRISRCTMVKTGAVAPWSYACTPNAAACASKTASITIVRNGQVFGYTGCVMAGFTYTVEDGMLKATYSIIGSDEASASLPTPTFAGQERPFGAGEYSIQIPTATQVFDTDTFEWAVNDNGEPQFRLKTTRNAQFIKFGEREVTLSVERDFGTRADYDAFKALTAQAITIEATLTAPLVNEKFTLLLDAAIKDTYEVGLEGQGDLIRASISYNAVFDATNQRSYRLTLLADEDITIT
jgi:Phage tail tube protein